MTYTVKQLLAEKPNGVYVSQLRERDYIWIVDGRVVNTVQWAESDEMLVTEDWLRNVTPDDLYRPLGDKEPLLL